MKSLLIKWIFCEQAISKQIVISNEICKKVTVFSNLLLIEILISNLFLNAINHNKSNGKIKIILNKQKLVFVNSGIAKPLQKKKCLNVFQNQIHLPKVMDWDYQ